MNMESMEDYIVFTRHRAGKSTWANGLLGIPGWIMLTTLVILVVWSGRCVSDEAKTVALHDVCLITSAPVIDGKLSERCWQNVPEIMNMVLREGDTRIPARVQTRTKILYDKEALYIGIIFDEPDPTALVKKIVQYDGNLWLDDSVEIYLETGSSHEEYFKFSSNPCATRGDWLGKLSPMGFLLLDWGTGSEWTVASSIGVNSWSLEFRIPWSDLEVTQPCPGTVWTFEIVRFRHAGGKKQREYSCWNVGSTFTRPDRFGNIVFSGTTTELERVFSERLKPVFGGSMRIFGRYGEMRYLDYATIKAEHVASIRNGLSSLKRRYELLHAFMNEEQAKAVHKLIIATESKFAQLSTQSPSASLTESLISLMQELTNAEWILKCSELNASLQSSPKGERDK